MKEKAIYVCPECGESHSYKSSKTRVFIIQTIKAIDDFKKHIIHANYDYE